MDTLQLKNLELSMLKHPKLSQKFGGCAAHGSIKNVSRHAAAHSAHGMVQTWYQGTPNLEFPLVFPLLSNHFAWFRCLWGYHMVPSFLAAPHVSQHAHFFTSVTTWDVDFFGKDQLKSSKIELCQWLQRACQ